MTDDVGELVLRDNYLQSQAISLLQANAAERLGEHAHFIRSLELEGMLDRALEFLPSAEEIEERRRVGQGLTRPELAMVLSYAKIALNSQLIQSDVPEDPYLGAGARPLLPGPPREALRNAARPAPPEARDHRHRDHQQHREPHGPDVRARARRQDTGADAATVARAYTIAREVVRRARHVDARSRRSTTRSRPSRAVRDGAGHDRADPAGRPTG